MLDWLFCLLSKVIRLVELRFGILEWSSGILREECVIGFASRSYVSFSWKSRVIDLKLSNFVDFYGLEMQAVLLIDTGFFSAFNNK